MARQKKEEGLSHDEEYILRHRKYLRKFYKKFRRWQDISDREGDAVGVNTRKLEVVATPNGTHIVKPGELYRREDKVLDMEIYKQEGGYGLTPGERKIDINITPGEAGKHHFIDAEGKPVLEVNIQLAYLPSIQMQEVSIYTRNPRKEKQDSSHYNSIRYREWGGRFGASSPHHMSVPNYSGGYVGSLSNEYVSQLLTTIDYFIPVVTTPIPQQRRRSPERLIPTLPPSLRRPARR